jgi:hypothetical protein
MIHLALSSFSVACVLWGDGIQFYYFVVPSLILVNCIDCVLNYMYPVGSLFPPLRHLQHNHHLV